MRTEREIRERLDKGCIHFACTRGPGYLCQEMRMLQWVLETPKQAPVWEDMGGLVNGQPKHDKYKFERVASPDPRAVALRVSPNIDTEEEEWRDWEARHYWPSWSDPLAQRRRTEEERRAHEDGREPVIACDRWWGASGVC
jgi:hypothetical protein